jgi:1,4-alpha-glucan branching enzyme
MVTTLPDGNCRFRVYLPHATRVELVGDFTNWRDQRLAMNREHPGWWDITVNVEPGEHQFCYLVDGAIWLADYAAHGVKLNGYGGWISRLHVAPIPANTAQTTRDDQAIAA